ncbi:hypothetical protein BBO99_00001539 [Phytophthora kernoviae]|uniref:PH domain-containing protein n=2 Tax=Phytophthora kernoviae TaxID=325452 RepID=A0A3R7K542_9STRA|nr:hypothetical protein G195_003736 [Phytophthora kernoviae 00238/432]KAG2530117.1 hypothetical protein JM18_002411 [Phytophthora kernoviae]KAG2531388.1 hypothetical protein JM16_001079 [Phytophthora kernoviae]RLN20300.1 hypothetical protein BBI17_001362 [Phytophthora kernoviae]RLN84209.1 hypothetical protein BBO99_00001539 [Phytophthora kernoviae]
MYWQRDASNAHCWTKVYGVLDNEFLWLFKGNHSSRTMFLQIAVSSVEVSGQRQLRIVDPNGEDMEIWLLDQASFTTWRQRLEEASALTTQFFRMTEIEARRLPRNSAYRGSLVTYRRASKRARYKAALEWMAKRWRRKCNAYLYEPMTSILTGPASVSTSTSTDSLTSLSSSFTNLNEDDDGDEEENENEDLEKEECCEQGWMYWKKDAGCWLKMYARLRNELLWLSKGADDVVAVVQIAVAGVRSTDIGGIIARGPSGESMELFAYERDRTNDWIDALYIASQLTQSYERSVARESEMEIPQCQIKEVEQVYTGTLVVYNKEQKKSPWKQFLSTKRLRAACRKRLERFVDRLETSKR